MRSILNALKSQTLARVISVFVGISFWGSSTIWLRMIGVIPESFNPNPHNRYTIGQAHSLGLQSFSYQTAFVAAAILSLAGAIFLWQRNSKATLFFVASFACYIYEQFAYHYTVPVNRTLIFYFQLSGVILGVLLCIYVWWATSKKMEHPT
ncbi:MAG: hypothetical protein ABSC77_02100 [Terracidiphilus sp.]